MKILLCFSSKVRAFLKFSYFLKNQEVGKNRPFRFFLYFSVVSPHHKRNGTRLLSPQMKYVHVVSQIFE